MGKITFWYCDLCEKEVDPSKKPLDSFQKTIWGIVIICTLGFGIIAYLIYNKSRKKKFCPTCETALKISEEPFEKPKPLKDLTPKEKVLVKAGKKVPKVEKVEEIEEEEEEKIFCPFCGEELKEKYATCPFCGTAIKF